jgi:hypothetical protein
MGPDDDVEIVRCRAEGDDSSKVFAPKTMAGHAGLVVVCYRILPHPYAAAAGAFSVFGGLDDGNSAQLLERIRPGGHS